MPAAPSVAAPVRRRKKTDEDGDISMHSTISLHLFIFYLRSALWFFFTAAGMSMAFLTAACIQHPTRRLSLRHVRPRCNTTAEKASEGVAAEPR